MGYIAIVSHIQRAFFLAVGAATIALVLWSPVSTAKPVYLVDLDRMYPGSRLTKGCNLCHTVAEQFTAYGHDFIRLKELHGLDRMDQVWDDLRHLDSDNDGVSNDDELLRDRQPGYDERYHR